MATGISQAALPLVGLTWPTQQSGVTSPRKLPSFSLSLFPFSLYSLFIASITPDRMLG